MAGKISMVLPYTVDVNAPLVVHAPETLLMEGDKNANIFEIKVMDGDQPEDLTGYTVAGSFTRQDGGEVDITGTIEGNVVKATLNEYSYAVAGTFGAYVQLINAAEEIRRTILLVAGYVQPRGHGPIIDTGKPIASLDDIIAQLETMKTVTAETQASKEAADIAASKANAAASHAPYVGVNGNWYVWDTAISKYRDTNVKATGEPGTDGITPVVSATVTTGEPGTQASVTVSGTVENPIFNFVIPRGDTGAVDGVDYYTGTPAPLGTASPGTANGLSRGDHVHPFPIVLSDTEPEVRPALWLNSDPWGTNAAVATMMLEDDETGSDVQIEVDGEDYAVTNTNLGDPESGAYGVTTEEE